MTHLSSNIRRPFWLAFVVLEILQLLLLSLTLVMGGHGSGGFAGLILFSGEEWSEWAPFRMFVLFGYIAFLGGAIAKGRQARFRSVVIGNILICSAWFQLLCMSDSSLLTFLTSVPFITLTLIGVPVLLRRARRVDQRNNRSTGFPVIIQNADRKD